MLRHGLLNNANWYIDYGPSPLTKGKMPYLEANLLENILNTADTCIVKKENNVTLRFGHGLVYFLSHACWSWGIALIRLLT